MLTPEELAAIDREIQLQLDLLRHASSVEGKTYRLLETMRKELVAKLGREDLTTWGKARLNAMLKETSELIDKTYQRIAGELAKTLEGVASVVTKNPSLDLSLIHI